MENKNGLLTKEELLSDLIFKVKLLNNTLNEFFEEKPPKLYMTLQDVNNVIEKIESEEYNETYFVPKNCDLKDYSFEIIDFGTIGEPNIQTIKHYEDEKVNK
jgi:hypothetical protein